MKLLLIGDLHGHVFQIMVVLRALADRQGIRPDLIIQVGDLGAYPDPEAAGLLENRFVRTDRAELDFSRLLRADGKAGESIRQFRDELGCPIHFIRGNHEDYAWLGRKAARRPGEPVAVDPFGLFVFLPDGYVFEECSRRIGCLGGTGKPGPAEIDEQACRMLLNRPEGDIEVLVTHDAPLGVAAGFRGQIQGSEKISRLVEAVRPRYLFSGHYHISIGPWRFGDTTHVGLASLVPPARDDPAQRLRPGSMALLDLANDSLEVIRGRWLSEFDNRLDYAKLICSPSGR